MSRPKKRVIIPIVVFLSLLLLILIGKYFLVSELDGEIDRLAYSQIQVDYKNGKVAYKIISKNASSWVDYDDISKEAIDAIVISEDALFWQHDGFDLEQIKEAVDDHITKGKKLRGASTISQQLTKNLFLDSDKTFTRKAKEALITKEIESKLSKKKILESYLNIIEYGEGVYGIKAASKHYFDKEPSELSAKEGAFLAMLLPNPKKYSQSFKQGEMTDYAQKTVGNILNKMKMTKKIDHERFEELSHRKFNFEEGEKEKAKVKELNDEEKAKISSLKRKKKRNKFDRKRLSDLRNMINNMEEDEKKVKADDDGNPIVKKEEDLKSPGDLATNEKLIQDEVIGVEEEMSLE